MLRLPAVVLCVLIAQMGNPSVPFGEIERRLHGEQNLAKRLVGAVAALGVAGIASVIARKALVGA